MDETKSDGLTTLGNQVNKLSDLMNVVVVVLIIMTATLLATVAGIVVSAYQNQAAAYQSLSDKVNSLIPTTVGKTQSPLIQSN